MLRFLFLFVAAVIAVAQTTTGTIVGTIRDSSGAIITGAKIRVTNEGTNIAITVTSNDSGDFVAPNLPAAVYSMLVESPGMRPFTLSGIQLLVKETYRGDIRMEPGALQQNITVTAQTAEVSTDTSSVATVVDQTLVATLPVNGRTLDKLVLLAAGNASDASTSNPLIGGSLHWGGVNFNVDGVTMNDTTNGGAAYSYSTALTTSPSIDTVQEVKVEATNAKAESEGSASITMISKSGTNRFHGSLLEFNRNRIVAARNFFTSDQPLPRYNRNEFGGTFSGPIVKNRIFFFSSYEGLRQRTPRSPSVSLTEPTAAMRQGVFTTSIKDPLAKNALFPNNTLPASRIDPRAQALAAYFPLPNQNVTTGYNYIIDVNNIFNVNRGALRLDYKLTDRDSFAVSLNYSKGDPYFVARGTPPNFGNFSDAGYTTKTGALTYTRIIGSTAVNELRLGYFVLSSVRLGQNIDFNPATLFPDLYGPLPVGGLPTVNITGVSPMSDYGGTTHAPKITTQVTDNFSVVRGAHTIKTGFDFAFNRISATPYALAPAMGSFSFTGKYTGVGFADFLLGYLNQSQRGMPSPNNLFSAPRYSVYVQDDWHVMPRLTVNFGIRYMIQPALSERSGAMSNFDFSTGQLVVETRNGKVSDLAIPRLLNAYPWVGSEAHGWGDSVMRTDKNNVAPRFGFAWRPFTRDSLVVRGAYGIYYAALPAGIGATALASSNPPFSLSEQYNSDSAAAGQIAIPNLTFANPFPGTGTISANPTIYAVDRDARNTLSQQWNLTFERRLPMQTSFRVTYLGNKSTRVPWYQYNMNLPVKMQAGTLQTMRPYQPWADILTLHTQAQSFTNQLQAELTRRMRSGFFWLVNYTLNKTIDNADYSANTSPQNPYNASLDRGIGQLTRIHNFNFSGGYELPFGPGKKFLRRGGLVGKFTGGWMLNTLTTLKSGTPLSVVFTTSTTTWYMHRTNVVGDWHVADPSIDQWFNPKAFAVPPIYTQGNSGRNILFGPWLFDSDLSLIKSTRFLERYTLQFRTEAFNFPNHPSFGPPANSVSSTNIGQIRATSVDNRVLQFGLKLLF
jgi:hypothetical protein